MLRRNTNQTDPTHSLSVITEQKINTEFRPPEADYQVEPPKAEQQNRPPEGEHRARPPEADT